MGCVCRAVAVNCPNFHSIKCLLVVCVVCREDCTYAGTVGISRGDGYCSCGGDGVTWNGSANTTDSFVSKQFCGGPITGWCVHSVWGVNAVIVYVCLLFMCRAGSCRIEALC